MMRRKVDCSVPHAQPFPVSVPLSLIENKKSSRLAIKTYWHTSTNRLCGSCADIGPNGGLHRLEETQTTFTARHQWPGAQFSSIGDGHDGRFVGNQATSTTRGKGARRAPWLFEIGVETTMHNELEERSVQHPSRAREGFYPSDIRQLARLVERAQRKERWRRSRAVRSAAIARAIRDIERALGAHIVRRERRGRQWLFLIKDGEVAVRLHVPTCRSFDELAQPLEVEVIRPDLLDVQALNSVQ